MALPGDSLAIRDGRVYVNGTAQEPIAGIQYTYLVQTSAPFSQYAIDNLGVTEYSGNGSSYYMSLTAEAAGKVEALKNVISIRRYVYTPQRRRLPAVGRRPLESGQLRPDLDPEAGGPRCRSRRRTCPSTAASSRPTKAMSWRSATTA